jgi:hypothetical protein
MATTPNTNFTSGQILTAAQQNNFPRGLMAAPITNTSSQNTITTEVALNSMSITFTAEADRIYKATYMEPNISSTSGQAYFLAKFRKTNIAGTVLGTTVVATGLSQNATSLTLTATFTTTAGSTVVILTGTGSPVAQDLNRSAGFGAVFMIEDIGAA